MPKKRPPILDEVDLLPDGERRKYGDTCWLDSVKTIDPQLHVGILELMRLWVARDEMVHRKFPQRKQLKEWIAQRVGKIGVRVKAHTVGDVFRSIEHDRG